MPRPDRSTYQKLQLVRDVPAVYDAARSEPVELGTFAAKRLRGWGVGIPPLWASGARRGVLNQRPPASIHAFQGVTRAPASCLWAARTTRTQVTQSLHIEFVGEIARVCEAVDIEAGGAVGEQYTLSLGPPGHALFRCLDVIGLDVIGHDVIGHDVIGHDVIGHDVIGHDVIGHDVIGHDVIGHDVIGHDAGAAGWDGFGRLRAWFPWHWAAGDDGRPTPHAVAEDEVRSLRLTLEAVTGARPLCSEKIQANAGDLPELSESPTRDETAALLRSFLDLPS